jgi:hypothetical protein
VVTKSVTIFLYSRLENTFTPAASFRAGAAQSRVIRGFRGSRKQKRPAADLGSGRRLAN